MTRQFLPLPFLPVLAAALIGVSSAQAQTEKLLFDFGAANTQTLAADDPLNTWNNITDAFAISNTGQLLNLLTSANLATDIDFLMISRFNSANTNGTTTPTLFPTKVTQDSLFGNTEVFNTLSNVFPSFKRASLDPLKTYDFTFYASRAGVSDNRETLYTVSGSITGTVALNPSGNVSSTVSLAGVAPNAAGEITISLTPGPNTANTANLFTYLGAMQVISVPEPSCAVMLLGGAGLLTLLRRRRSF